MAEQMLKTLVARLTGLAANQDAAVKDDAALLQEFLDHGTHPPFACLVQRHGPMVLGVCRRVMGDAHEAEDVFQAVFMVLARQRRNICCGGGLGGWLYRVAYLSALKARHRLSRRAVHEKRAADMNPKCGKGFSVDESGGNPTGSYRTPGDPAAEAAGREARAALEEELSRLPPRYRSPVILCCLEGKTYEDAARELGWPTLTVKGQLARARGLLRERLARRGFALSVAGIGVILSEQLLPAALLAGTADATATTAAAFAAGQMTSAVSPLAASLAGEMLKGPALTRRAAVLLLLTGGIGVAGTAYRLLPVREDQSAVSTSTAKEESRKSTIYANLAGHGGNIYAVKFSPDGRTIATGSGDRTVKLWSSQTGRELATLPGHNFTVHRIAFSTDGKTLASATVNPAQPTICLWNVVERKPLGSVVSGSRALYLTFTTDGKTLVAVNENMSVKWWNVGDRQCCGVLALQGGAGPIRCAAYSPTTRVLAVGDHQGKVWLGDIDLEKRPSGQPGAPTRLIALAPLVSPALPWWDLPLAFSPDGRNLAIASPDAAVHICDVATKRSTPLAWPRRGLPQQLVFSPDGRSLAIAGRTAKSELHFLTLWDLACAREQITLTGPHTHTPKVMVAFDPGGDRLAWAAKGNTVDLWQLPVRRQPAASGR